MTDNTKNTSTVEPDEEQTPNTENKAANARTVPADTKTSTPASVPSTATGQAIQNSLTRATLPDGYLANGSMLDESGVMRPEYLDRYPQELAQKLKPLSASSFQRAFLSKAKEANKKKVPYSAKKNCAQGMTIAALKLVKRAKDPAPAVLLDMIRVVSESVVDDSSFSVMFTHLDAICTYMMLE